MAPRRNSSEIQKIFWTEDNENMAYQIWWAVAKHYLEESYSLKWTSLKRREA